MDVAPCGRAHADGHGHRLGRWRHARHSCGAQCFSSLLVSSCLLSCSVLLPFYWLVLIFFVGDGLLHRALVDSQAEGYVIGSCIKHIPVAGRDITAYVQQLLRDREVGIPPEQSLAVAKAIKERYSYVCPDIVKEFQKYDQEGAKWIKQVRSQIHC